jgi:hypothetical protein
MRDRISDYTAVLAIVLSMPYIGLCYGPIDKVAQQADAIVVAEVQTGTQTGRSASLVLSVTRVLKGSMQNGDAVTVLWSSGQSGSRNLTGSYGLWFLKRAANTTWYLLSLANGQIPIELAYLQLAKGATNSISSASDGQPPIGDLIALEISGALPQHPNTTQLFGLATTLLGLAETPTTLSVLRPLRVSSDPELRFLGLAGLVGTGDWSPLAGSATNLNPARLAEARSALAAIANDIDTLGRLAAGPGLVGHAVAVVRDSDSGSVAALGKIASSAEQGLQTQAAYSLACIHTGETLPFLAQLLDSPYTMVRENAVLGMGRFVNNLPITTSGNVPNQRYRVPVGEAPYRTAETDKYSRSSLQVIQNNEAEYVQFWKSWWATMKNKLTP